MIIEIVDITQIIAFWLIVCRLGAIMMQLPIFDNDAIPTIVKVLSTMIISYVFFPHLSPHVMKDIQAVGSGNFWILTIFYTLTGLLIGYLVKAIVDIFYSAGSVITQQVGFSAMNYFDPNAGQQVGPFEKLIQWTMVVLIVSSGALLPMFKGACASFEQIHLYDLGKMAHVSEFFVRFFKQVFESGLLLASPLIFINILISMIMGIIARTVPQMNVIMVSFVVNIGLGLIVFISISEEFFHVAYRIYTEKLGDWFLFFS